MAADRLKFQRFGVALLMACAGVHVSCGRDHGGRPSLPTLKREMEPFSERHPGNIEFYNRGELLVLLLEPEGGYVDASEFDAEANAAGWTFKREKKENFWTGRQYSKGRVCLELETQVEGPSAISVSWSSNPVSSSYCNQHSRPGRTTGTE